MPHENPTFVRVIIRHDDRSLVMREMRPMGIVHNFPGGVINPGESPAEAAFRELYEETRLRALALLVLGDRRCAINGTQLVGRFFLATEATGVPVIQEPKKCQEILYVTQSEALRLRSIANVLSEPLLEWGERLRNVMSSFRS